MAPTGTHSFEDLKKYTNVTAVTFGLAAVADAVQLELDAHNRKYADIVGLYAAPVTERETAEGTGNLLQGRMEPADEYSRVRTQKDANPAKVAFPMEGFQYAIGMTAEFLRRASPAEIVTRALGAQAAHRVALIDGMRYALFLPTNRTVNDYLKDDMALNLKALYNGDGAVPRNGPNGELFTSTHNHYVATAGATLTGPDLDALIVNVAEHNGNADIRLHINVAQETTVRGLTGFVPAADPRIVSPNTAPVAATALVLGNRGNRIVGYYNGAEVWVKPWVPASYVLAVDVAAPIRALGMRVPEQEGERGLIARAEITTFPLQARYWDARFGFAARNRSAAAVLYIGAGGTYVAPNLPS